MLRAKFLSLPWFVTSVAAWPSARSTPGCLRTTLTTTERSPRLTLRTLVGGVMWALYAEAVELAALPPAALPVYDSIPHVADLASLQEPFFPFYVFGASDLARRLRNRTRRQPPWTFAAAVRKVFFFLDKNHAGKIQIPVAVTSAVMAEWLQLSDSPPPSSSSGASEPGPHHGFGAVPPANWFSASNALRVYRQVRRGRQAGGPSHTGTAAVADSESESLDLE